MSAHGTARRAAGLSPVGVLLCGIAAAAACMLLLYAPWYPTYAPGQVLEHALYGLLADRLPFALFALLLGRLPLTIAVVLLLVLVLLPVGLAKNLREDHRPRRGTPSDSADPVLVRSLAHLRARAEEEGIPWSPGFETEGGARGVLEILNVIETQPAEGRRPVSGGAQASAASPESAPADEPAAAQHGSPAPGPSPEPDPSPVESSPEPGPVPSDPVPSESFPAESSPAESSPATASQTVAASGRSDLTTAAPPRRRTAEDIGEAGDVRSFSRASWSPGSNGSVYTSTSVYTSSRLTGEDPADARHGDERDGEERDGEDPRGDGGIGDVGRGAQDGEEGR